MLPKKSHFILLIILLLGLAGTAVGCRAEEETVTLRMALLPIMDTLPMYVAQEQGYFAEENLAVEFIPVASAPDRDQLINSGQADGMVNEVLSTMFYNADEVRVVTVSYARKATPEFPHFYILAGADSGIANLDALKGREIGISEGTIIEYTTDRLLQESGFTSAEINTVAVPRIPDRLALLQSGELDAANFPDPLAALAVQQGATVIIDDSSYPLYGHSVITFRREIVEQSPEAITGFLRAIQRAVDDINSDKSAWGGLLTEQELVPQPLLATYTVPDFPDVGVPTQAQWDDMLAWAMEKEYLDQALAYGESIDDSYLP